LQRSNAHGVGYHPFFEMSVERGNGMGEVSQLTGRTRKEDRACFDAGLLGPTEGTP
jgi:hypothetical protein